MIGQFDAEYSFMENKIQVNGKSVYWLEKGTGNKTAVFLAGSGVSSVYTDMYALWNKVSERMKVFIYDRPGMGKSEETRQARDIDTVTEELNAVLEKSGQGYPYILVAHSMAGLQAIRFAQIYPHKVAGIVFIDAASPEFCENFNDPMKIMMYVVKGLRQTGLLRLLSCIPAVKASFESKQDVPPDIKALQTHLALKNIWNSTMISERKAITKNGRHVREAGKINGIKVITISAGNNGFTHWDRCQEQLITVSDTGEHIFLPHAGHFIHHEYMDTVAAAINKLYIFN